MDAFAATRLAIGVAFLTVAAIGDLRTRRVADPLWVALGSIGLALLGVELLLASAPLVVFAILPATAILFYAIFYGSPLFDTDGFHPRPVRLGMFGLAGVLFAWSAGSAWEQGGSTMSAYAPLLSMPVMVLVYQGLYQLRLLHGGADAKAMIALTLLLPTYPDASPFPLLTSDPRIAAAMELVFPFSLVILVDAALLYLFVPLVILSFNTFRGDVRFPQALFGYRADLERPPKNVWLMERIDERGRHILVLMPRRGRDQVREAQRLREAGITRVWVQPKIPFMIPLLLGLILAFFVGNVLLLLFP